MIRNIVRHALGVAFVAMFSYADESSVGSVLSGRVINAVSGMPIHGATVVLIPANKTSDRQDSGGETRASRAVTDEEGKYRLSRIHTGTFFLSAQKHGFLQGQYRQGIMEANPQYIRIHSGSKLPETAIAMVPHAVVAGRVFDEDGNPIAGAEVLLARERIISGRQVWVKSLNKTTDEEGKFYFANVPPGSITLQATPPVGLRNRKLSTDSKEYITTFHPSAATPQQAERIQIVPAGERYCDIVLSRLPTHQISGKVIDDLGRPTIAKQLRFVPTDHVIGAPIQFSTLTTSDGSFSLSDVPSGTYYASVVADNKSVPTSVAGEEFSIGNEGANGLIVHAVAPLSISGRILVKSDDPLPVDGLRVYLIDEVSMIANGGTSIESDGTFLIRDVVPNINYRVKVTFERNEDGYIEAINYSDDEVAGDNIRPRNAGLPLTITIARGVGKVHGRVKLKDQGVVATVVVTATTPRKRSANSTRILPTDQDGLFEVNDLAPGEYLAFAFESVSYAVWESEERMNKLSTKAKSLSVKQHGMTSIELEALPSLDWQM